MSRSCKECQGSMEGRSPQALFCNKRCYRRWYEKTHRRKPRKSDSPQKPQAEIPGTLAAMTDAQASRLYEVRRAQMLSGEIKRTDPAWIDARDEMEIRVQEHGMIRTGKFIYLWSRGDEVMIRRLTTKLERKQGKSPDECRVYHHPDGFDMPAPTNILGIAD